MRQYQMTEFTFKGCAETENIVEINLEGIFSCKEESVRVKGFYAGNGIFKIRFLPLRSGAYHYVIRGLFSEEGNLWVEPAEKDHHGIPSADGFHLRFSDGTLYTPFGTTVYALVHQDGELVEETFRTLAKSPFNKVRLCIFPKHYQYNHNEPARYPFAFLPGKTWESTVPEEGSLSMAEGPLWDVKRPDPVFWDKLDEALQRLEKLGIVADLILFHPYDRWGFSKMTSEENRLYLEYAIRRLGAFPNLMWSLANEFDLIPGKSLQDWYDIEEYVAGEDPYHHMLSNHNCFVLYDYGRPNITHVSIQTRDPSRVRSLMKYGKPVLVDECAYEGNLEETFGSLTGQEMTDRFWKVVVNGGYCTHGETFVNYDAENPDKEIVFWAKGGSLKGESPKRIAYLRAFTESLPGPIEPDAGSGFAPMLYMSREQLLNLAGMLPEVHAAIVKAVAEMGEEERLYHLTTESEYNGHVGKEVFIRYFGKDVHGQITMDLPEENTYVVEVIDTWNMTSQTIAAEKSGHCKIRIPEKPWIAVVARRTTG